MTEREDEQRPSDRRTESREGFDPFYSVELAVEGAYSRYQFKLRNISARGLCIVVREDSAVLENLNVGDVFDVKLYQGGDPRTAKNGSAQVRHITQQSEGRYQGHYLVGLSVPSFSEQEEPPPEPA